jgi:hypothetical protein
MALASWTGIYGRVIRDMMRKKQIKELSLLQLIATCADPFGFGFPGPKLLLPLMHCSKATLSRLMTILEEQQYIKIYETSNPYRGTKSIDIQVNPRVMYVREEVQEYCDGLWDGNLRDSFVEKRFRENLFSTKDSQPESESESLPDSESSESNQSQHHQRAPRANAVPPLTTGHAKKPAKQRESATPSQRPPAQTENPNPQAGGAARPKRDLTPYRKPLGTMDDEDLAQDIKLTIGTQLTQARWAVATYNRSELCIALELTRQKASRGELGKPGGYFFSMLENGVILPGDDGPAVFKPRVRMGDAPEQDTVEHWNPKTGHYEPAAGE